MKSSNKTANSGGPSKILDDVIKVEKNAFKLGKIITNAKVSTAAQGASAAAGSGKAGLGLGAMHHAGVAAGGGAGGGFLLGKACGLKLGLGLAGFGGPLILAGILGVGGFTLYKMLSNKHGHSNNN